MKLVGTGKKYSFFINSEQKTSGANRNQYTYYVDWDRMPEGKYHLHFTYIGQTNTLNGSSIAYVSVDMGANVNAQYISSTGNHIQPIVGILNYSTLKSNTAYLYADDNINEDIYLENKPSNPYMVVSIWKNTAPATLYTDDAGAQPAPYMLGLHFELVEEQ